MNSSSGAHLAVRGKDVCGVLHDPGAASGLIGSDTLNEVLGKCNRPSETSLSPSDTQLAGISGKTDTSLGEVRFPMDLKQIQARFIGDVIGGHGSRCPGLLPLPAHIQNRAITFYGFFNNDDGLMCVPDRDTGGFHLFRLLLTDSGHYLLPVDGSVESNRYMPQSGLASDVCNLVANVQ